VRAHNLQQDGRVWVECVISDEGEGFIPGDLPHVFEPFYTRRSGGTGLGLALVQRIVEQHGGSVEAENLDAGGAAVRVRLPMDH
jgi:signal transduction histidine kinase